MAKVFQIVNDTCYWLTPYESVEETKDKYPEDCIFIEAPDKVTEGWGYKEQDEDGNPLTGDDRFIPPVPPEGWIYDEETGAFFPESELPNLLKIVQDAKQEENKAKFAEFLDNHPITWVDGKQYGVTMEDQSEIQLNMSQYQVNMALKEAQVQSGTPAESIPDPVLEWHAIHEACTAWTVAELSALVNAISTFVYPYYRKMQDYKVAIYNSTDRAAILAMNFEYKLETDDAENGEAAGEAATDENVTVDETTGTDNTGTEESTETTDTTESSGEETTEEVSGTV